VGKMDAQNEEFMWDVIDEFNRLVEPKFRKGQKEHGGFIGNMSTARLLDEAMAEAIDSFVYLYTLKQKLKK